MSKRTSSARLAGWLGLFVILSAALAVTAFALTRSDGPKPPGGCYVQGNTASSSSLRGNSHA